MVLKWFGVVWCVLGCFHGMAEKYFVQLLIHKTIADYFNQFFTTLASVLVQKLRACSKVYDYKSEAFRNFYKSKNPEAW